MIGVIVDTYFKVTDIQHQYVYQGRALLNLEYFALKKYFFKLEQFRILIFASSKEPKDNEDREQQDDEEEEIMVSKIKEQVDLNNKVQEAKMMLNTLKTLKKE